MTHFEQLFIALNAGDPQGRHCIQAHSPGLGTAVGQEILDQCLAWASGHPGGLDHAVVLSFPLKAVMPAIKGPLFAIIRVTPTFPVAFHALVMSKRDFRAFDYNPFAVLAGDIFLDSLTSGQRLNRGSLEPPRSTSLFGPAPNPGDVGLVDEGLQLFLLKGKLILNLDSPGDEADRVMGLIIQFLPLNLKEKLRFASFSGSGDPGYTLAACFASGNSFASWQRLFMTMENQGIPEPVRKYVAQVRNALVAGDPQGVNTGAVVPVGRNMVEPRPGPSLTTVPVGLGATSIPGSPQNRQAVPAKAVPGPSIGLARAVPTSVGVGRPGGLGPDPAPARGRGGRSRLIRQALPTRRPPVTRRSRQLGVFTLIVALLVVGWVYLDRSGKGRQWGIFDLMGAENRQADAKQAPSLLEVVDVGAHYNRQLSRIQRSRLIPGKGDDRQLRRAQAQLLADAAGPLLQQVDLFVELARGGIQQGHRPDREKDRLRALALQGRVLEAELGRLELAYFSFGQGVLWSDLDRLSDTEVAARRDSLARVRAADLGDATRQVGSESCWDELASACRNTEGMADMLDLFQATQWSAGWERDLKAAAEKVSPTASPMSRAYRNNAFTLLRLKKAERSEVEQQAAFADDWRSDSWLSPGVRDVLTDLRHKSALFGTELRNKSGNDRVPALLQGVLSLYARLEKPEALVQGLVAGPDVWRELQANAGRRFDPAVYQNHLDRARYEALARLVGLAVSEDENPGLPEGGVGLDGPAGLPGSGGPERECRGLVTPGRRRWTDLPGPLGPVPRPARAFAPGRDAGNGGPGLAGQPAAGAAIAAAPCRRPGLDKRVGRSERRDTQGSGPCAHRLFG